MSNAVEYLGNVQWIEIRISHPLIFLLFFTKTHGFAQYEAQYIIFSPLTCGAGSLLLC